MYQIFWNSLQEATQPIAVARLTVRMSLFEFHCKVAIQFFFTKCVCHKWDWPLTCFWYKAAKDILTYLSSWIATAVSVLWCWVIFGEASKRPILIVLTIFSATKEVYKEKVVSSGIFMSPVSISEGTKVFVQQICPQKLMSKRLQHDERWSRKRKDLWWVRWFPNKIMNLLE